MGPGQESMLMRRVDPAGQGGISWGRGNSQGEKGQEWARESGFGLGHTVGK